LDKDLMVQIFIYYQLQGKHNSNGLQFKVAY